MALDLNISLKVLGLFVGFLCKLQGHTACGAPFCPGKASFSILLIWSFEGTKNGKIISWSTIPGLLKNVWHEEVGKQAKAHCPANRELTSRAQPLGEPQGTAPVSGVSSPPMTSQETLAPCHTHDSALASASLYLLIFQLLLLTPLTFSVLWLCLLMASVSCLPSLHFCIYPGLTLPGCFLRKLCKTEEESASSQAMSLQVPSTTPCLISNPNNSKGTAIHL